MCSRIFLFFIFYNFFYFSQTTNVNWQYVGPKQTTEQVKGLFQSIWVDSSNSNFALAGSACGGLFKTENAMDSIPNWINITDSYSGINCGVSDIVVKPNTNNKTIYISTAQVGGGMPLMYGNGILKTTDGGINWKNVGPKAEKENLFPLNGLKINRENENEMIAYTKTGFYITTNDWQTFKKIELPIPTDKDWSICDVEFAPFEKGKFYISTRTYNYYNPKLFVFTNFGEEVKDITPENSKSERIEIAIVFSKKFKTKFYIASGNNEVFVSFFNGLVFSKNLNTQAITQTAAGSFWNLEFEVNQIDTNIMYLAMTECSRTLDGGKTFEKIASYNAHNTHADIRGMYLSESTNKGLNDKLFLANDGGISYLQNCKTINWKSLNGIGLNANMFWGIDVAQSDTLFVAGGTQDNGNFLITQNTSYNNVLSCGDGYLASVINEHSAVGECNAPSLIYWNFKTNQQNYLSVPDEHFGGRRPITFIDTMLYIGHHNIWKISKRSLENNQTQFEKVSDLPIYKNANGSLKNSNLTSFAINKNKIIVAYSNPNWDDINNTGKLLFCKDISNKKTDWIDLTPIAIHGNSLAICRWSEITSLVIDNDNASTFYFITRDVFNQTNSHIYELNYFIDSNKCIVNEITFNLLKLGINKIIIDKYSNIMYAGVDDGVYYKNLNDSVWKKLNGNENKLPNLMILDLVINYATNTLFVSAFGRGIYKIQLISNLNTKLIVSKNKTENSPIKIDGSLTLEKKKIYTIKSKLIITKGSVINLHKGSTIIIENKNLIRDENNNLILIDNFIKKHKTAKVIFNK